MPYFNIVAQTTENTVVTEYEAVRERQASYQTEPVLKRNSLKSFVSRVTLICRFIQKRI